MLRSVAPGGRWTAALALAIVVVVALVPPVPRETLDRSAVASTRVLDRHGRVLWEARSAQGGYGRWVTLDRISPHLVAATLSGEDAGFFGHLGIDPIGVARAVWLDARAGRLAYGGSTLTQQLAKMLDPRPRTAWSKLVEAWGALRLERTLTKAEILEQYLNRAYYGRNATGVEAAAQRFFGKSAYDLTLDEAALLAILPRAPSAYDPARHPERARRRRAHVLAVMVRRGLLPAAVARRAARAPVRLVDPSRDREAPHVVDHLLARGLLPPGAPEVRTTIDLALQERLERALRRHLLDVQAQGAQQGGLVVLDNASGEVLAMVGSRRYGEAAVDGSVNAVTSLRHPGSTLKPFVYALALEDGDGRHPGSPVFDVPTVWRGYQPRSVSGRHLGVVSFREALGSSVNVSAVRLTAELGVDRLARLLHDAGVASLDPRPGAHGLPLALGAAPARLVELADAYATLARGGLVLPHRLVRSGHDAAPRRVLSAETAYLVSRMLADPGARRREFGVETPLELPFDVAVKTGTSEAYADNVVVGYTPERTVAVWTGSFDGRGIQGLLAMQGAAPLFRDALLVATEGLPRRAFARPAGIERVETCPLSGLRRGPHCPHVRSEEVAHAPHATCAWHGLAGVSLPAEVRAWQTDPAAAAAPSDGPPIEILGPAPSSRLVVDHLLPRARQRVLLRAAVRAPGVSAVRWEIDGRTVAEVGAPFSASWTLTPGRHRLRAVAVGGAGAPTDELAFVVEDPGRETASAPHHAGESG